MSQHEVILLLGSNINNPEKNIEIALEKLEQSNIKLITHSKMMKTKPVEFASVNYFCNFALIGTTFLSPIQLLKLIKTIEVCMGRKFDSSEIGSYEDRIIDIDIVSYDHLYFRSKKLSIPHLKHLFERDFSKELLEDLRKNKT